MFQLSNAAIAAQNSLIANFSKTTAVSLLFLMVLCLSSQATPPSPLAANHSASIDLSTPVSQEFIHSLTIHLSAQPGFKECEGSILLSSDGKTLTFHLNNPSEEHLPANTAVATIRLIDQGIEQHFSVQTDSGGIMIILQDL